MNKTINVRINTGKEDTSKSFDVVQGGGDKGASTRIKAVNGARYQLENPTAKGVGPVNIRSKRVSQLPC